MRCDYNSTSAVYVITQKNLLENIEMAEVKSEAVEQYQEARSGSRGRTMPRSAPT